MQVEVTSGRFEEGGGRRDWGERTGVSACPMKPWEQMESVRREEKRQSVHCPQCPPFLLGSLSHVVPLSPGGPET